MMQILSGIVLLAASVALFYPFIPAAGAVHIPRPEWIDISIAITFAAGLALGIGLVAGGAVSFWM